MGDTPEMLTVTQIDEDWKALGDWPMDSQSLIRMSEIFDMARRAATEIPEMREERTMLRRESDWQQRRIVELEAENERLIGELRAAKEK